MAPPLIVIGMHRSGTSVVAQMLDRLGVYMGPQLGLPGVERHASAPPEVLAEAPPFLALNERLLARAGATWDVVDPFLKRRGDPRFEAVSVALLGWASFGSLRSQYLSPLPPGFEGPWGWKDPRSSVTLPHWLRLFPRARILHVCRDPAGVVRSLHRRALAWQAMPAARATLGGRLRAASRDPWGAVVRAGRRARLLPPAPVRSDPCLSPAYCHQLALQYVAQCFRLREQGGCYLEVRYEDLLLDPVEVARQMAGFSGAPASPRDVDAAASLVCR